MPTPIATLTRPWQDSIVARLQVDPAFRCELERAAEECWLEGELATWQAVQQLLGIASECHNAPDDHPAHQSPK